MKSNRTKGGTYWTEDYVKCNVSTQSRALSCDADAYWIVELCARLLRLTDTTLLLNVIC